MAATLNPDAGELRPEAERVRDEDAYDEDELDEDEDDDDDDETMTCVAVDAKYKLSAKQLARYRAKYPWFGHDEATGRSWCSTCKRWEGPSTAMKGLGASSRDDGLGKPRLLAKQSITTRLSRHDKCEYHAAAHAALAKEGIVEATQPLVPEPPVAPAEPTAMDRASEEAKRDQALRRLPHALAALQLGTKGRPATDFPDTLAMIEKSAAALGATRPMEATHCDSHFVRELWGKMSEQIGADKRAQIRASPVLCVGADESTDSSTKENMVVYLAWMHKGKCVIEFLEMVRLVGGTKAEQIEAALVKCLANWDPNYAKKLVGFSSDGASVMTGSENGVTTRFRRIVPWMLNFHCICHKLALGANDASKRVDLCADVEQLLRATYGLFSQSAKRLEAWEEIAEKYDEAGSRVKKLHNIRWLARAGSLASVVQHLDSLMDFIQGLDDREHEIHHRGEDSKETTTKVGALAESWRDFELLAAVHFCADIFGVLADITNEFQREYLDITAVTDIINAAKRGNRVNYILGEKMTWAAHTRRFLSKIKDEKMTIGKTEITGITDDKLSSFYNFARELALAVNGTLDERFPDFAKLEAFRICSPVDARKLTSEEQLATYGDTQIRLLAEHYKDAIIDGDSRVFDKEAAIDEWNRFRTDELWKRRHMEWRPMWEELLVEEELCARYSNLFFLAMCALVFMLGNASCERGFSVQNRLKGPNQNRMDTETLDVRMRIAIHAPHVSDPGAVDFAAKASDAFWLPRRTAPARAVSAAASASKRRATGQAKAADAAAAKQARIDGSSNKEVTGDRSEELTARAEFKSETHVAMDPQPTSITTDLKGAILAKLTYDEDTKTETWDVGRVKDVTALSVTGPDGQAQPNTHTIQWQIGLTGRGDIYELHVSIDSCGPKREWLMVKKRAAKPAAKKRKRSGSK